MRQSVLPSLWWESPETSVVPISEKWIAAEAAAGAIPAGDEQRRGRDAVPHAERAVDELRGQGRRGPAGPVAHRSPPPDRFVSTNCTHFVDKPVDKWHGRDPVTPGSRVSLARCVTCCLR